MKTLIVLSAIAGAGKSTWAEQYRKTHHHVYVVSSDEIRKELTGAYSNLTKDEEMWRIFFSRISEYANKHSEVTVIADSTCILNKYRLQFKDIVGYDKKTLVVIRKELPVILKQNLDRNESKIIPESAVKWMWDHWEEPNDEVINAFDEYVQVTSWFDSSKVKDSFHYKD